MKLKDINAEITFELWIKPELSKDKLRKGIGYIIPDRGGQGYKLSIHREQWKVLLRDASVGNDLNFHLKRGCAHLAEITQFARDGSALLKVIFFNGEVVETGDIEIGLDDSLEATARKNGIRFKRTEELAELFTNKFMIQAGAEFYFLIYTGRSADEDFESGSELVENYKATTVDGTLRSFSLCGERLHIPVQRKILSEFEEIFSASRVVFRDKQKLNGSLRLARGRLKFTSTPERIRGIAAGAMSQLTKEAGSYLKQWDKYGAVEGEMLLARAKAIGKIDYHRVEKTSKGVKFFVQGIPDGLTETDEIEITSEEPLYLLNPELTWEEYSSALEDERVAKKDQKNNRVDNSASEFASVIGLSTTETSIELNFPLPPDDNIQRFLILSINGNKIQIERRMKARSAILEGRCANPLLGLIIEEGGVLPQLQRVTELEPLTSFVREKIFKHNPTDKQIEAIDIALNTPDIALIQGPPGTGKTTVVTAILERLNEEYDKTKSVRGQILVSGFQHDAVENIVSRLSINALPAVKFGKSSNDSEFTEDAVTEKINKWCSDVAEKIRDKNPRISKTEDQVRLAELFSAYLLCPSKNNTMSLMGRILELPRDLVSEDIISNAIEIIESLKVAMKPGDPSVLRLIRALRVSEAAFNDDGAARAIDLLDLLEDKHINFDLYVLEKAARWCNGDSLNFLSELRELKGSLLHRYLPYPDFRIEKPREDVLSLVTTVSQLLKEKLSSTNKRDIILAEFLHELEDNPDGAREAIEEYNFVFAATTQQSAGKHIINSKNKKIHYDQRSEMIKYDTVIIDEAARTSPRDLLIPMSQAEKRIILVGDHRQLPHLIDEEVARVLEGDELPDTKEDVDFVKNSMFEYLFGRLKKLEEKDKYPRTVTLDAQYRTHPILGKFASDNFYEIHGEGYRSPLKEEYFKQDLEGLKNKAAVWIDVPNNQGKEKRLDSGSRERVIEAQHIAEYLNRWVKSEEGSKLSFGVISFYKAQVYAVYKALQKYGITERAQDGSWQISKEYRFLEDGGEWIRLGTVDSFQGMEFDVVLLSMVRSQDLTAISPYIRNEENDNKKQQKIFGHLMSVNRLCVSMSRQKKVLAMVGDGDLANSQIGVDAVPALKNFYDLCHEYGVIL